MKFGYILPPILLVLFGCHSSTRKAATPLLESQDSTKASPMPHHPKNDTPLVLKTHLRDTVYVAGSFLLFLRPDGARYAELNKDPDNGAGDGDADFGVGISNTEDSVSKISRYKDVQVLVSTKRYIAIQDCIHGPMVIDRDSVCYGYILSAKDRQILTNYNSVHSGDYLVEIDDYFFAQK